MDIFSLAVNLVNENAILAECLCMETAAEYLYKVKYFKINLEKIDRLLGLCFHNCGRRYFTPSLCFTSSRLLSLNTRLFPMVSQCVGQQPEEIKARGKNRELRRSFKSVEDRECILIISGNHFVHHSFQPWFFAFSKYLHQDQGQRNLKNIFFDRNRKRRRNYTLKGLIWLLPCVPTFINSLVVVWIQPLSLYTDFKFLLMSLLPNNTMSPA